MTNFFLNIYDVLVRHRSWVAAVTTVLLLACGFLALRMDYDEDIAAFMPMDRETARYAEVLGRLGGEEQIAVIFRGRSDDQPHVQQAMEAFAQAVARCDTARWVRRLQARTDEGALLDALSLLGQAYPLLLDEGDYARLDSLLRDDGFWPAQMADIRRQLMLPTGSLVARQLPNDPLQLGMRLAARLRGLHVGGGYRTVDGYLFKDSAGIVLLQSAFGMHESRHNGRLQQLLDSCMDQVRAASPQVAVSAVGAPLIAVTNATQVKQDSLTAVALAVALILLVLVYAFRRMGPLAWVALAVLAGWLFALGTIALLRGGMSLIVLGIGSVVIGIAVNYPLHFIDHLRYEPDVRGTLREMVPPLLVGNVTTVSAFLCLLWLDSRALRDLGLLGSLMLAGTILFVLVCLPVFLTGHRRQVVQGRSLPLGRVTLPRNTRLRRAVLLGMVGLTVAFACLGRRTSFDTDMQHINYMLPAQREDLRFLASATGAQGASDSLQTLYAVAEGATTDEALRRSEALAARLDGVEGVRRVTSVAGWLPSDSLCRHRLSLWNDFWRRHPAETDRLARAAADVGFAPGAFASFIGMTQGLADAAPLLNPWRQAMDSLLSRRFVAEGNGDGAGCMVVSLVQVRPADLPAVKARIAGILGGQGFVFGQTDVGNHMARTLSESFDYIGLMCGCVVFLFLWLSLGSLEMAFVAFLPLAVGWVWILGIMQLLGLQFNIVNIILATFIFGQGDDYAIFITEGLMYEYTTGRPRLERYKDSVALPALIMFIGIGTLIFSQHPALRSLAEVAIIGMAVVVLMACYLPPLLFGWLTRKHGRLRECPVTLWRLAASGFCIAVFACGMFLVLIPYTLLVHRPLQRIFHKGEIFYHRLLQRISHFVIRHVPGVRFRQTGVADETLQRPAVIICNHQSHLDLMCLMQLSPKIIVLTNDWVWNNPYYGVVIHAAEFRPVSQGFDHNFPLLQDLVRRGYSIAVFPEGTRTPDGQIGRFHKGAFTLAKALQTDVLPVCIHGLYNVLPKHDFMLRRGSVTLEVCPRLSAADLACMTDRELTRKMHCWYVDKYARMRSSLETPAYRAPYEAYRNKYKLKGI